MVHFQKRFHSIIHLCKTETVDCRKLPSKLHTYLIRKSDVSTKVDCSGCWCLVIKKQWFNGSPGLTHRWCEFPLMDAVVKDSNWTELRKQRAGMTVRPHRHTNRSVHKHTSTIAHANIRPHTRTSISARREVCSWQVLCNLTSLFSWSALSHTQHSIATVSTILHDIFLQWP